MLRIKPKWIQVGAWKAGRSLLLTIPMTDQVLTRAESLSAEKDLIDQYRASSNEAGLGPVRLLYDRQATTQGDSSLGQTVQKSHGGSKPERLKKRARKARQGGWPSTKFISRELCHQARAGAGLLSLAGYPFTVFATARAPLGLTDGQAKRHIARSFARLGQALERKGHSYIGLVVYEKPVAGLLHGHALLHVRRECLPIVKRWADRFDERPVGLRSQVEGVALHARPAIRSDLAYILKQRRFNGPFERFGLPYERSEAFAGTRVSFTKVAHSIIRETERRELKNERAAPRLVVSNPITARSSKQAEAA
jgi:hypothetical protein